MAGRKTSSIKSVLDGLTPDRGERADRRLRQPGRVREADLGLCEDRPSRRPASPTARRKLADNRTIFDGIEASYATPREIVAAIWGMESSYGAIIGDVDAPRAIASQAAIGRRKDFNEGELMAIMQLIENGSATRDQFRRASWAGAVGQTQFMPSTFLAHGRDFDRDGKKDLWTNTGDALASAANYLTASGWKEGPALGGRGDASRKASTTPWATGAS